jgi:cytochrome c oxidase assembly factor CtaG
MKALNLVASLFVLLIFGMLMYEAVVLILDSSWSELSYNSKWQVLMTALLATTVVISVSKDDKN